MNDMRNRIVYCMALICLLLLGVMFGYFKTVSLDGVSVSNDSALEFAKNYSLSKKKDLAVTASTKTYDITVIYEDYYTVCKETVLTSKIVYGTTMDEVIQDEEEYQTQNGLVYNVKEETETKIVYERQIEKNCPNHFEVILEDDKVNVYTIESEDVKTLYLSIDGIVIENLRDELKVKVKNGTYINSKDELNQFIEDLET